MLKNLFKDWRVKQYARKLARQSAMADLDLGVKMRQLDCEAQEKRYTLRRQHETERELRIIESGAVVDEVEPVEMTKLDRATLEQANIRRKMSKRDAMSKTLQLLAENPNTNPSVIAEQIGRSRQTVYDYIEELQAAGKFNHDGHGQIDE